MVHAGRGNVSHVTGFDSSVREFFPNCLISVRVDICWTARFPESNSFHFFPIGYIKAKVFFSEPRDYRRF